MLSLLMSCYNKAKFVGAAIESVLGQSDGDLEVVVVDDASTDSSVEEIGKYLGDPRVKLIRNERNLGMGVSSRRAAERAGGDLMGLLDADDVLVPEAVARMKVFHARYPDCGLIYSAFQRCDVSLRPISYAWPSKALPEGVTLLEHMVKTMYMLVGPFRTFTREAYLRTPGFGIWRGSQDLDLALKIEEVSKLLFVDEMLYYYRKVPRSASGSGENHMPAIVREACRRRGMLKA